MRSALCFVIQPSGPEPLYRQLIEQVRRLVASGSLRAGDELPSVRSVAQEHAINPMTVSKAYSLLEAEGVLARKRGLGMVVADVPAVTRPAQRLALLEPALRSAAQQAAQLGLRPAEAIALFNRCLVLEGLSDADPPARLA